MTAIPPAAVLAAFGVGGEEVQRLAGGLETSVRAGDLVLKRVQDPDVSAWSQQVLSGTQIPGLRIPRPVAANDKAWLADGWIATEFVGGLTPLRSDPGRVVRAGDLLADALARSAPADCSAVLRRRDRWALADRFVWGEHDIEMGGAAAPVASLLRSRVYECVGDAELVHGDLTGNVFVDDTQTPVVLDFTPYVRPRRYAAAIVVADNLLWHGGGRDLLSLIDHDAGVLARALLFRLAVEELATATRNGADVDDYRNAVAVLGWS